MDSYYLGVLIKISLSLFVLITAIGFFVWSRQKKVKVKINEALSNPRVVFYLIIYSLPVMLALFGVVYAISSHSEQLMRDGLKKEQLAKDGWRITEHGIYVKTFE